MIAVRYLESLKRQKYKIADLIERRETLRQKVASAGSINYSQVKVQTSHNNDALTSAVVKVSELTERIEQAQAQYFVLENEIISKIRGLHNLKYEKVLYKVYIQFKAFPQIASELKHGVGWIRRLHDDAVQEFSEVHRDFFNEWVIDHMKNSEQIKELMNRILEVQRKKRQILDEEAEIKAAILEQMQENQVEKLENANIKINYVEKFARRTVDGKKLKELYPDAFRDCTHVTEISPHIRVKVLA